MKRAISLLGVALLVMVIAGSAMAENANQRVVGMKGIGYYSSEAPVGVRYWMSEDMAIDFGVGLRVDTKNPNPGDSAQDDTLFDWAFDVGLPWVMHGEENMIVYFRPGATIAGINQFNAIDPMAPAGTAVDKHFDLNLDFGLALGGEFFLGQLGWPNLSFSGQVGVELNVISPGEEGAETDINFATRSKDVSIVNTGDLGFRIYF